MDNFTPTQGLCSRWNAFLLSGFFLVILGTIALGSAFWTTLASVMFFGILLTAAGIANIFHSFWASEWKGFFSELITGILSSIVGLLMLGNPGIGAASITLLLAVFFIATGLFKIAGAFLLNIEEWGWVLLNGVVALALGILILLQWPSSALWVIGLFIALNLLISGWSHIMFSLSLRKACKLKDKKHTPSKPMSV